MNTKINTSNLYRRVRKLLAKTTVNGCEPGEAAAALEKADAIVKQYSLDRNRFDWPELPAGYKWDWVGGKDGDLTLVKVEPPKKEQEAQRKPAEATKRPKPKRAKRRARPKPDATRRPKIREGTKQAALIAMLRRPGGATIDQMAEELQWQRHTVRGAMSGSLKKKLGLQVRSRRDDGATVYWIER